jgi:hypothetical protein
MVRPVSAYKSEAAAPPAPSHANSVSPPHEPEKTAELMSQPVLVTPVISISIEELPATKEYQTPSDIPALQAVVVGVLPEHVVPEIQGSSTVKFVAEPQEILAAEVQPPPPPPGPPPARTKHDVSKLKNKWRNLRFIIYFEMDK